MTPQTNPEPTAKCGVWTVHSEIDNKPSLRGFAKTKADAEARMAKLKADDSESEFWLVELTYGELEDFRNFGMLPPGF
jgi:hypothetical protein